MKEYLKYCIPRAENEILFEHHLPFSGQFYPQKGNIGTRMETFIKHVLFIYFTSKLLSSSLCSFLYQRSFTTAVFFCCFQCTNDYVKSNTGRIAHFKHIFVREERKEIHTIRLKENMIHLRQACDLLILTGWQYWLIRKRLLTLRSGFLVENSIMDI